MIFFPNKTLQRYTPTQDSVDVYGATTKQYEYTEDVQVDFQNETNKEEREAFGVTKENLYKIYFDKNTNINSTDQLHDTNGDIYEIIGEIRDYNHFHDYKKANLIKRRRN